jgi:hypothetical protein
MGKGEGKREKGERSKGEAEGNRGARGEERVWWEAIGLMDSLRGLRMTKRF